MALRIAQSEKDDLLDIEVLEREDSVETKTEVNLEKETEEGSEEDLDVFAEICVSLLIARVL